MERPVRVVLAGFVGLWSVFSLGLVSIACTPAENLAAVRAEERIEQGIKALRESRPDLARQDFADALVDSPSDPEAAFGLALSEALMLPESPAVRGGLRALGLRSPILREDLYGAHGILADLAQGLEPEAVRRRLFGAFGLDRSEAPDLRAHARLLPASTTPRVLAGHGRALAAELLPIASWFEAAAGAEFRMVIPGGLLHLDGDLVVGPGEAAALAGAARMLRASILAVTSYGWDDSPLTGLAELDDAELSVALSEIVVAAAPPTELVAVASELRRGLRQLADALAQPSQPAGAAGTAGAVVAWNLLPVDGAEQVRALLLAARDALAGPTRLPDSDPPTTLDLAQAVTFPPSLPAGAFVVASEGGVTLREGFLTDLTTGVANPPLALDPEPRPILFAAGQPQEGWLGRWLEPLFKRLETDLGL